MAQTFRYPSGSASVTISAVGSNGAPIPTDSILIAGEDPSGNLQQLQTDGTGQLLISSSSLPLPTGAATATKQDTQITELQDIEADIEAMSAKLPATLGAKTIANSLSINVASDQTVPVSAASLPLPSGAATLAEQQTQTTAISAINTKTPALGQTVMASSSPVVIASNQSSIPVSVTSAPSTETTGLTAGALNADLVPSTEVSLFKWFQIQILGTWSGTLAFQGSSDNSNWVGITAVNVGSTTAIVTATTVNGIYSGPLNFKYLRIRMTAYTSGTATGVLELNPLTSVLTVMGALATQNGTWNITNVSGTVSLPTGASTETTLAAASAKLPATLGQKAMAASMAVAIASDQSTITVAQLKGATNTVTSVASSASSVSLLASNANRTGATFYNDSSAIAYVKLGTTASTSSFTIAMAAGSYYELPFENKMYTGAIDAIWASATGNMRISEFV